MGRRVKRTRKVKRTESFTVTHGMTPQEFLDKLQSLPNHLRKKTIIREAQALV
jgi:hypothetical protein